MCKFDFNICYWSFFFFLFPWAFRPVWFCLWCSHRVPWLCAIMCSCNCSWPCQWHSVPQGCKDPKEAALGAARSQLCTVCAVLCSPWLFAPLESTNTMFNDMCEVWDWGLSTSSSSDCVYVEEHMTFTGLWLKRVWFKHWHTCK